MTTINAKLVAEAGMLPKGPVEVLSAGFRAVLLSDGRLFEVHPDTGIWTDAGFPELRNIRIPVRTMTAFGLAVRLDAWEGNTDGGRVVCLDCSAWAEAVAKAAGTSAWGPWVIAPMLARIECIGMDHAIRRALGWEVERGTLATHTLLDPGPGHENENVWAMHTPGRTQYFGASRAGNHAWIPALAGITNPAEALAAIYAEVCS